MAGSRSGAGPRRCAFLRIRKQGLQSPAIRGWLAVWLTDYFSSLRTARVGARRRVDRAAALGQRLAQQPLDLAVDAAQLLSRQRLDRGGDRRIEAQQERLSCGRLAQDAAALLIQRAGIDHGLRLGLGAQHDQQVRHHRRACARRRAPPRRVPCRPFSAISTMLTAPSTICLRAPITASACCRRSIAPAISGA